MPLVTQIAPDDGIVPQEEYLRMATEMANVISPVGAEAVLKLFKSGEVTATAITTVAEYDAAECDFTGYLGIECVGTAPEPYEDESDGSYLVTIPSKQFNHGAVGTANDVGGWWLVDDDGNILMAGNFAAPITMEGPTDSIVLSVTRRFGP